MVSKIVTKVEAWIIWIILLINNNNNNLLIYSALVNIAGDQKRITTINNLKIYKY